ncbi:hypothetical protein [Nocardia sp. BMG51109]|uniref:hypothetical protein n=1 Tax=Nocardia sp. BMG51109 TaxID=1056816 RepID=UPI000466EB59|nr:hypothetical protein [Nocardia sp. BMG51109]
MPTGAEVEAPSHTRPRPEHGFGGCGGLLRGEPAAPDDYSLFDAVEMPRLPYACTPLSGAAGCGRRMTSLWRDRAACLLDV